MRKHIALAVLFLFAQYVCTAIFNAEAVAQEKKKEVKIEAKGITDLENKTVTITWNIYHGGIGAPEKGMAIGFTKVNGEKVKKAAIKPTFGMRKSDDLLYNTGTLKIQLDKAIPAGGTLEIEISLDVGNNVGEYVDSPKTKVTFEKAKP